MTNHFSPPESDVRDLALRPSASLMRTATAVGAMALTALALSWLFAPLLAGWLASALGQAVDPPGAVMLGMDVMLSLLAFTGSCLGAGRLCPGRERLAVLAVAAIGSAVFFWEAGGLEGMLYAGYPLWYEFVPTHVGAAVIALRLLRGRGT